MTAICPRYVRDPPKYEFFGWQVVTGSPDSGSGRAGKAHVRSGAGSDELIADGAVINSVNSSVTLTAKWKQISTQSKKCKLTYNANGTTSGKVPMATTEYAGGEKVLVAAKDNLFRKGYKFREWNTKPDGTGVAYRAARDSLVMPKHDVTLYAIWIDGNGNIPSPGTGESGVAIAIAFNLAVVFAMAIGLIAIRVRRNVAERSN